MQKKLDVDSIVFIGRTFDEYVKMFGLDMEYLKGKKILDCPAGACSFIAELTKIGIDGVGADILYDLAPETLKEKCRKDLQKVIDAISGIEDLYVWDFYGNIEGLKKRRIEAYQTFIEDYVEGVRQSRYVKVELPYLPFKDEEFSLVLSAHFLFLYGDRLDYEFHIKAIRELIRVASEEVRVFPVLGLDGKRYSLLDKVIEGLIGDGLEIGIVKVPFEFQKNGNEMLKISKRRPFATGG